MDETPGWLPCAHDWVSITELGDEDDKYLCALCGENWTDACETNRGGWRHVETHVDVVDGMVRMTIIECETRRIVYSSRYHPKTAREIAYNLTVTALSVEDD